MCQGYCLICSSIELFYCNSWAGWSWHCSFFSISWNWDCVIDRYLQRQLMINLSATANNRFLVEVRLSSMVVFLTLILDRDKTRIGLDRKKLDTATIHPTLEITDLNVSIRIVWIYTRGLFWRLHSQSSSLDLDIRSVFKQIKTVLNI